MTQRTPFIIVIFLLGKSLFAQTGVMQVVSKKIESSFHYQPGYEVNIEGHNAEILIETWDKDQIVTKIEFIAKHPDVKTAKVDVEKINHLASRIKNKIYLRNYIPEKYDKPQAILKVRYQIKLPKECPVYVKNHYGKIELSNLSNRLRVNTAFTSVNLDQISGLIDINTRFGELLGVDLSGKTAIDSRRSDINLVNVQGELNIAAHYGTINIEAHPLLRLLKLEADMADVNIYTPKPQLVAYQFVATGTKVQLPPEVEGKIQTSSPNHELIQEPHQWNYLPQGYKSLFDISINFSDLKIATLKKLIRP